jgi:hypothetical protein
MASSLPSSVKSEPAGALYSGRGSNLAYTPLYDTSLENTLSSQTGSTPQVSSSIYIGAPAYASNETPYDLQGVSAPTLPVYINMGLNERTNDVHFGGPTTPDAPLSHSFASFDIDHTSPPIPIQRQHSHHHAHHFPHNSQNRNRYPYLQRPISSKAINGTQASRTSLDGIPYYEQRPAFRRSYFALRKPRIPKGIERN